DTDDQEEGARGYAREELPADPVLDVRGDQILGTQVEGDVVDNHRDDGDAAEDVDCRDAGPALPALVLKCHNPAPSLWPRSGARRPARREHILSVGRTCCNGGNAGIPLTVDRPRQPLYWVGKPCAAARGLVPVRP